MINLKNFIEEKKPDYYLDSLTEKEELIHKKIKVMS